MENQPEENLKNDIFKSTWGLEGMGKEANSAQEWAGAQISEEKKIRQKLLKIRHNKWLRGSPGREIL